MCGCAGAPTCPLRLLVSAFKTKILTAFFPIADIDAIVHPMSHIRPSYFGIFEDNDPSRRLIVVANYDNGVPEYWEWSGKRLFPFDASNEAYKLGVNDLIYGLSH